MLESQGFLLWTDGSGCTYMDVSHINPFIAATRDVFETVVRLPAKVGKPYLKRPDERLYKLYKFAAIIGLSGSGTGLCVLNLSEPVALALAGGLTGTPVTRFDAACLEALGHIANVIAGAARKRLSDDRIRLSLATVVRTHRVVYPAGVPVIGIPADTGAGRLILEIALRRSAVTVAAEALPGCAEMPASAAQPATP